MSSNEKASLPRHSESNLFYWDESKKPSDGGLDVNLLANWHLDKNNLQDDLLMKFLGAAQHNQLDWLKNGIEGHVPLDLTLEGHTVLTIAAQSGAKEVIEYLLDCGLNPAFYLEQGMYYNAYFAACAGGQFAIIDLLLNHSSQAVQLNMAEPRHHQSGLQVAVHNLQFDCAKQLIAKYPESLLHLDSLKRTVFATTLSIFDTSTFNDYVEGKGRERALEDFCLHMLAHENPFQKVSEHAMPSIQVILHPVFASFMKSEKIEHMSALNGVRTLHLVCPKLADALMCLADKNPKGKLEYLFLNHSKTHLADVAKLR